MSAARPIRLSVQLCNAPEGPYPTVDYFPHRVSLKDGHSHEDVLLHLLTVGLRMYRPEHIFFDTMRLNEISQRGLTAPYADLAPGAIVCASDQKLEGDIVVIVDREQDPRLSDGRTIPVAMFKERHSFDTRTEALFERHRQGTLDWLGEQHDRMQISLALILAALPAPLELDTTANRLGAIMARIARLLELRYASGAEGSKQASKDIQHMFRTACDHWLIKTDQIAFASSLIAAPELQQLAANIPDEIKALTSHAWEISANVGPAELASASIAKKGEDFATSNHQSLKLYSAISALDDAIESNAPMALLRPAAQKRQARKRSDDT